MELAADERRLAPSFQISVKIATRLVLEDSRKSTDYVLDNEQARLLRTILAEQRTAGELDLRDYLSQVSDKLLWQLGACCPRVLSINCSNWTNVSVSGLRSISLGFGDRLEVLKLSQSPLTDEMVTMLAARFFAIRSLDLSGCLQMTNGALRSVAEGCNETLTSLDISECGQLFDDAVTWIAGTLGSSAVPCAALQSLSMQNCTLMKDGALIALGKGCRALSSINIRNCWKITDVGILGLCKGCKRLRVANFYGCTSLTDISLTALGKNCHRLRSLNMARCSKISDKGLTNLSSEDGSTIDIGAAKLQALNIAGCVRISEQGVCSIVDVCRTLQILNVTGCELITQNGLDEMVRGLPYVEPALSYTGFKPKANAAAIKLRAQLVLVKDNASFQISAFLRGNMERKQVKRLLKTAKELKAASLIQRWIRGIFGRDHGSYRFMIQGVYLCLRLKKLHTDAALFLQRFWRGRMGCLLYIAKRAEMAERLKNAKIARKVQAIFRGQRVRKRHPEVPRIIAQMKEERYEEVLGAVVVRAQALVRTRLVIISNDARREELHQRARDMNHAAIVIQSIVRVLLGKLAAARMRAWIAMKYAKEIAACKVVQKIIRGRIGRKIYLKRLEEHQLLLRKRDYAATNIQRVFRGKVGRDIYKETLRIFIIETKAATQMQRIFRGQRVDGWRELKFEITKQIIENRTRKANERSAKDIKERLETRKLMLWKDSASEADDASDPEDDWQEHWDKDAQRLFYFSPSRGIRSFQKYTSDEFELSLINKKVRLYAEHDACWYDGRITRYSRRKKKHKIEFDDGETDRIWLKMRENEMNIQIYDEDTQTWSMFIHCLPQEEKSTEAKKDEGNAPAHITVDEDQPGNSVETQYAEWEELFDPDTNLKYYYNFQSGQTFWELPDDVDYSKVITLDSQ